MLLSTILKQDWYSLRGYLRTKTITKGVIVLLFLGLMVAISGGIYALSNYYFGYLVNYSLFGQAVATYSINASLVILFILSILTSTLAAYPMLYSDSRLKLWQISPIKSSSIFRVVFVKLLLVSGWPVGIALVPILLAYANSGMASGQVWFRGIWVIIMMLVTCQSLGTLLIIWAVKHFGRVSPGSLILWLTGLLMVMGLTGRLLFPPELFKLTDANNWNSFRNGLGKLPVMTNLLPTNWWALTITRGWSGLTYIALGLTIWLLIMTDRYAKKHYLAGWHKSQKQVLLSKNMAQARFYHHFPHGSTAVKSLAINDTLALIRSPNEMIYYLFVLGLGIALYAIVRVIPLKPGYEEFRSWINLAVFGGFSYLVIVSSGRFVFPLMAKETKVLWLLFSAPIKRQKLIDAKLMIGLGLLLPWVLLGLLMATTLASHANEMWMFGLMLIFNAINITATQVLLGIISPNFSESERPDAVSTSGSGLVALGVGIILTVFGGVVVVYKTEYILIYGLLSGIWLTSLFLMARNKIGSYQGV